MSALGYWVSPGFLHWVLVREADDGHITFNDPWGGHVRVMDKAMAQKLYAGQYVHIDQPVSALAPAPPRA
jgi:predicted double-glycine peptidase